MLTLCGVLKDILLVMASMAIFGDPVTIIQYFGYSIALGGLVYYRLGGEKLQQLGRQTRLTVGDYQREHPIRSRAVGLCATLAVIGVVVWTWLPVAPSLGV